MTSRPEILETAATLSDPTRCRILGALEGQELTVSELCSVLQMPQSTVSRHLRLLAEGSWVRSRRDGTSHFYRLTGRDAGAGKLWRLIREQLATEPLLLADRHRLEGVLAARQSRSQRFFASTAGEWDRLRDELFGPRFDLLALLALLDPAWVVGDLACGTGRVADTLAPSVARVIGVDGSPAMLQAARLRLRRHANVELKEGKLEALPIDDAGLDLATLFLALHLTPEPLRVLTEARRCLGPGRRLLLVDMISHDREEYRQEMGHIWLGFEEAQILQLLADADLTDVRYRSLPAAPDARGPGLFVASARRDGS